MKKLILSKNSDIEVFLEPFHMKIMNLMKDRQVPMTVKEIADAMGEVPAKVHYHVKKLEAIGVLSIKFTKQVNGITAKYYDFTTDTVALSVEDKNEESPLLRSRMMKVYGGYFDEAKQKFYDLLSHGKDEDFNNSNVYITLKESFSVNPDMLDQFYESFSKMIKKYSSDKEDAASFTLFLSIIRNIKP